MPNVDFYVISDSPLVFACRLLEKVYEEGKRAYVLTSDEAAAHQLDDLLWTFRQESFIPHHLVGQSHEPIPPIEIGFSLDHRPSQNTEILCNLTSAIPPFFTDFSRVIELVPADENLKKIAREKYRQYQEAKCEVHTHK